MKLWMTSLLLVTFAAPVALTSNALPSPNDPEQEQEPKKDLYDESADAAADVAAALAGAKKNNRRVLIQWGANWCGWCYKLDGLFEEDRDVRRKLLYEYDLVHVDVGRFDKNLELAAKYGADLKANGLPFLTILDAGGKVLANQDTGSLEDGPKHDPKRVMGFLEQHQAEYWKAQELLDGALARAKATNTSLLLTFGAPWCGWCHRFEDWMAKKEVAPVLARYFTIQKIDTDRNVGGADMLTHYRKSDKGGIPWFAFLDGDGKELANSDGPAGNLGCPWSEEEIAAFADILRKVAPKMTSEELALLTGAMGPEKKKAEAPAGH